MYLFLSLLLGGKFICSVCNISFRNSGSLSNHKKRRHPDLIQARIAQEKLQRAALVRAKALASAQKLNIVSKCIAKLFKLFLRFSCPGAYITE